MNTGPVHSYLMPVLLAGLGLMLAGRAPAQTLTVLHTFNAGAFNPSFIYTNSDGASPNFVLISSNMLYGTAYFGGTNGSGRVFKINTDGTGLTNLHTFAADGSLTISNYATYTNSDGANPGGLILSGNTLYGTTAYGNTNGSGTVFKLNIDGTGFTNIYSFSASVPVIGTNSDGAEPVAGLIISNNTLYGATILGGTNGNGTLFKVNTDGTGFTNLHTFGASTGSIPNITNNAGAYPSCVLALSGNTLYGTTYYGGTNGNGTVFAVNTDGTGFTNLHTFAGGIGTYPNVTNSDGAHSGGPLLLSGSTLYGAAFHGGTNGNGTLFAISTNGTGFTNLHTFAGGIGSYGKVTNSDGSGPATDFILSNNTLYGTATYGGTLGFGTVFAINTAGTGFTNLHYFSAPSGTAGIYTHGTNSEGAGPSGALVISGNILYGLAYEGGTNGNGTMFSLSLGSVSVPLAVTTTSLPNGTNGIAYSQTLSASGGQTPYLWTNISGALPQGLTLVTNGVISGTPTTNGTFNFTVQVTDALSATATQALVLQINILDVTPPTVSITNVTAGMSVSNASFTVAGIAGDNMAVSGVYYSLNNAGWSSAVTLNNWSNWTAQVILIPGTNTVSVYAADTSGNDSATNTVSLVYILSTPPAAQGFTNLYNFNGNDGSGPYDGLVLSDNTLYGTTSGSSGNGTVFKVNTDGTGFTSLHSFAEAYRPPYTNSDGEDSQAGLILSGDTLYGTTYYGGTNGNGTVFALSTNGTGFTNLYVFTALNNSTNGDGAYPQAGLILSGNTLYGTASGGGSAGGGTVFALNTNGTGPTNLHSFTNGGDGAGPSGSLVLSGSTLYGTAGTGGSWGRGTVFSIGTNGMGLTNLHSFTNSGDGVYPAAGLILSGNTLYGTTGGGTGFGYGTVFKLNTNGTGFETLHRFTALSSPFNGTNSDGATPAASLVLSGNTLYGTAYFGGTYGNGTVFKVNTDGTSFTNLHSFTATFDINGSGFTNYDGANPYGALILSGNTLYGTAYNGGANGYGTVFALGVSPTALPSVGIATAGNQIVLSWPTNASSFALQFITNLSSESWSNVTSGINIVGTNNVFTNTMNGNAAFFRLMQ